MKLRKFEGKIVWSVPKDPGRISIAKYNQKYYNVEACLDSDDSNYSKPDDLLKGPRGGHIPGSEYGPDGKVVTNSGLRENGWNPNR